MNGNLSARPMFHVAQSLVEWDPANEVMICNLVNEIVLFKLKSQTKLY